MNGVGVEVRRGVETERPAVVERTVRQRPGADGLGGLDPQFGQEAGEALPGGKHRLLDLGARAGQQLLALRIGEAVESFEASRELRRQRVRIGPAREEACDVLCHAVEDDPRWHDAAPGPEAAGRDHLIDRRADLGQTCHVIPCIPPVVDLVDVQQEVGEIRLYPAERVEREVVESEWLAVHLDLQEPIEHLRGEALRGSLALDRVLAERAEVVSQALGLGQREVDREIVEAAVVPADAPGLEDSQLRQQLRTREYELGEDAGVEVLDRPGSPPDRRDREDGAADQRQRQEQRDNAQNPSHAVPPSSLRLRSFAAGGSAGSETIHRGMSIDLAGVEAHRREPRLVGCVRERLGLEADRVPAPGSRPVATAKIAP